MAPELPDFVKGAKFKIKKQKAPKGVARFRKGRQIKKIFLMAPNLKWLNVRKIILDMGCNFLQ